MSAKENDPFIIYGPKSGAPLFPEAIGKDLYQSLLTKPKDLVAMIDAFTLEKLLYSELLQKTVNLAAALLLLGYYGQEVIAGICSENSLEYFIPELAGLFNTSITMPINPTYTLYELEHVLKIGRPKLIFCSSAVLPKFLELKQKFSWIKHIILLGSKSHDGIPTLDQFIHKTLGGRTIDVKSFNPLEGIPSKLIAFIMPSSGTTGLPKGVAQSHLNLNTVISHKRDPQYYLQGSDTALGLLPFFHSYGNVMALGSFIQGDTIICLKRFDEDIFLKSIQNFKINTLTLVPPLAIFFAKSEKIKNYDLSCVTNIICAAAYLPKDIEDEVKKRLNCKNMRQGYGLTEATLGIVTIKQDQFRSGSCGHVVSYMSVKIADLNGKSLGPKQIGEIWCRGSLVMPGYYRNEKATKETFTPDGYLKTGDLGYYDEDGFFYIVDRIKDLIKYKGFQVAPAELEGILLQHPKIQEVGVVGKPDPYAGELPTAFVVKKPGADLSEKDVTDFLVKFVSPQKRLSGGVIFVDSIPKNPSGKILRRELKNIIKKQFIPAKL